MSPISHDDGALRLDRERAAGGEPWNTWYADAAQFSDELRIGTRSRLLASDFGRVTDDALRERVRRRLDVDFERLLDLAPPALAHRLGIVAAVVGHYRYSWPLLRGVAHAMPAQSPERLVAVNNWRLAALEANAWSAALEAVQMLAREAPGEVPFPVARYEPLRLLGLGGFAEVYLCRDAATGEQVVVKALARKPVDQWPHDVFHEARLLAAVTYSGVWRVREFGYVDVSAERGPYCVIDHFDGVSLHQFVKQCGALSWQNLRPILLSMLETLEAVHQAGVLHCDVKPGNIMLRCDSRGWQTQLIDFGIGVWRADQASGAREGERRPGTVGFTAPEQLGGPFTTPIASAVDVYSLGQTAIYALTAAPPNTTKIDRVMHLAGPLGEVLMGCIHNDPRHRPRVEQLLRFVRQVDIHEEQPPHEHETTRAPARIEPGTSLVFEGAPHSDPITGYGTAGVDEGEVPDLPREAAPGAGIVARIGHLVSAARSDDEFDCSAIAPPALPLGDSALVQVVVHPARVPLDERCRLTLTLVAPGLIVEDPVQHLPWHGEVAAAQFGVTVPHDGVPRTAIGTVQVARDGVPIGCVKFRMMLFAAGVNVPTTPSPVETRFHLYRAAFASYAPRDRAQVEQRAPALGRLGADALQFDPATRNEAEVLRHIDQSDLFLLFWSSAACDASTVLRDVRYALHLRASDGDLPEIVPVMLDEHAPLPPELAHLEGGE